MAATALFLSSCMSRLLLLNHGNIIGSGTGYFIFKNNKKYLVTAWHVLSGCDPNTGQPRSKTTGAIPDTLRLFVGRLDGEGIKWEANDFSLGDCLAGSATWYHHPIEGQLVDVGVLQLPDSFDTGFTKDLYDPTGHDPDMFIDTGAEVFLPGYPLGLGDGQFPIWKRANVATSLEWGEGVRRFFLVDTASREGMSGCPCICIQNWRYYRLDRSSGKMEIVEQPLSYRLLGTYSGRLNAKDDLGAQLGLVWRDNLTTEIIEGKKFAAVKRLANPIQGA